MKAYVVVKNSCLLPTVVFQSDNKENVKKWVEVMRDEDPESEYIIFERVEE